MGHVIWEKDLVQAQNPYYAELAEVNLYNLEELDYFLQKYFYLIDEKTFNDNLIGFLHTEMNRPDLAKLVYGNLGKSHPISIASKLIIGIEKMTETGARKWRELAADYQRMSPARQNLLQADILYQSKKFNQAREMYEALMRRIQDNQVVLENDEIARICYHLSRIAMESLSWKAAGAYLQEAYELTRDQEILKELYMLTCMSPLVVCDGGIFREISAKTVRGWNQEYNRRREAIEAQKSLFHYEDLLQQDILGNSLYGANALLEKWQEDFRKINKNSCQEMNSSV